MSARVIVGLSGGVDSAVAALLLKDAGWDVQGLFMSNWEEDDDGYCTAAQDYQDARAVAAELGIALHRASFARQYREQVFAEFLREHRAGRTPNPDVLCNREIKFGAALEWVRRLGATHFATGHYARLGSASSGTALFKARDRAKDQSYFLHAVAPEELSRTLMPLGELEKTAVRERARRAGLPVFDKPDSTGICFIGERPFREFLSRFLPVTPGPIESPSGERLGTHQGLPFYTLGQRGGLGIGGRHGMAQLPWYVAVKDARRNALVVVQGQDHPLLSSEALVTGRWHWLAPQPARAFRCGVKVRYRQADESALLEPQPDGTVRVRFERPQRAVTPGQYAVAYEGERCLGGAVIESIEPAVRESAAA
ncbi:MAG TPA: tRNA 2-thiouridine(34) synthase MnmA [Steroidobacteraceae bacterium]|jgi:tRNA-specific 2-thiouridylase|nr:tRNA 2-thiouridine(34) synthase MnmA [Steroidobacteraceae bacterium]